MRYILAVFLICHSVAGLAQSNASSVDYENQIVTIALTEEPPQLNSMKATDQVSIFVLGHVMEGLTRYDQRGNIVPGVARSWEIDETGATFQLRDDARWSDGIPVTAHYFVFAWRNALRPATASEYAFILYSVKNAEAVNEGELPATELGVRALDDHTLEVQFERPVPYFLKLAAFSTYFPVRQDFYESRGDRYAADAEDLLYNGPFKLTSWTHGASLKMKKNEHYWDKENIHLNGIHADYITSDTRARLNLFIDGKIAFTGLDGETYQDAMSQRFRIKRFSTGSVFFIEFNHREGRPTANLNLRKAIQHVFDPYEMVNKVLATPGNLPGKSLFPVWLDGVDGKFRREYPAPEIEVDADKANQLLARAREQLGVDKILPLVLLTGDSPVASKQAEYLQGLLKSRLGLDIKIDRQTFKQRLAKMTSGDFDMVAAGWGPDFDDVMTFGDLFASWNLNNRGRYSNPEYDKWVRVAMNSTDPKVRMDAMGKLQEIIHDDAVIIPQYEQGVIYLMHPKLKGVVRRVVGADPDYRFGHVVK